MTTNIFKIRVVHADGKRQKLALELKGGQKVPLDQATIGVDTHCRIEHRYAQVFVLPVDGAPALTVNNRTGKEFVLQVGDNWKCGEIQVEVLALPPPEPEPQPIIEEATRYVDVAATKFVDLSKKINDKTNSKTILMPLKDAGSTQPALPEQRPDFSGEAETKQPDEAQIAAAAMAATTDAKPAEPKPADDPTSMIFGMRVPKNVAETPPQTRIRAKKEAANATGTDRAEHLKHAMMSLFVLAIFAEAASHLLHRYPDLKITLAFGWATVLVGGLFAAISYGLKFVQRWIPKLKSEWHVYFRRMSWGAIALPGLVAIASTLVQSTSQNPEPVAQNIEPLPSAAPVPPPVQVPDRVPAANPVAVQNPAAPLNPPSPVPAPVAPMAAAPAQVQSPQSYEPDTLAKEAFFSALHAGDLSLVRSLVEKRAVDVNFTLERGSSPLHIAAAQGYLDIVKYLVSRRANINARDPSGTTPLMWAVFKRNKKVVQFLVDDGADLNVRRDDGDRAIDIAKRYGLYTYAEILVPPKRPSRKIAGSRSRSSHSRSRRDDD